MSDIITPDLGAKAAELRAKMDASNPSEQPGEKLRTRRRSMTSPQRRLETAELPGYHLQWIRGTPDRVREALDCGFEFVKQAEVHTNAAVIGSANLAGISTDLGDCISVPDGAEVIAGQGARLYLMKQPQEFYDEDMAILEERNDAVRESLVGGTTGARDSGERPDDISQRFIDSRTRLPDYLIKKSRKGKPHG